MLFEVHTSNFVLSVQTERSHKFAVAYLRKKFNSNWFITLKIGYNMSEVLRSVPDLLVETSIK